MVGNLFTKRSVIGEINNSEVDRTMNEQRTVVENTVFSPGRL